MSVCPRCGTRFECGMADVDVSAADAGAAPPCWCTRLPALPADAFVPDRQDIAASRCFCPTCLRALHEARKVTPQGP
jgi:Cysteine-rich CWC